MSRIFGLIRGPGVVILFAGLLVVGGWRSDPDVGAPLSPTAPPQLGLQDSDTLVRRVNAPYDVPGEEAAVFWFGRVTPTENSVDVRVTYNDQYLYVHVAVFDRRLWYDESPSADSFADGDSVSLYLKTDGNTGDVPSPTSYRFDAQLVWWEPRDDYPLCANIDETTPSEKLVYNRGRRKDGKCLITNQRRLMQKTNETSKYQNRKSYLAPSAGGFRPSTNCVSWKKPMVAPSAGRLAPSFVGKGYTLPICPHGGDNESWASWRACHPRSEAVGPKIRLSKKWLGCNERMNVFALAWNRRR